MNRRPTGRRVPWIIAIAAVSVIGAHAASLGGITSPGLSAFAFASTSGVPTYLAFTVQPPASVTAGTSFTVTVSGMNAQGSVAAGDDTTPVSIAIGTNPDGGTLSCTNPGGQTVVMTLGISSFTCSIDRGGVGYTLVATATVLTSATSSSFTVVSSELSFGALGAVASRTSSGSLTVNYPAGTQNSDLLLLVEVNAANQGITTPPGWTLITDESTGSPQYRVTVWWKLAAGESSQAVSINTNSGGASLWVVRYDRASGYPPNPATATGSPQAGIVAATATMQPTPGVTTNQSMATVISIVTVRNNNALSLSAPNGFTLRATALTFTGQNKAIGIADQLVAASGSSPTPPIWSQGGTAATWGWSSLAFA